MLKVLSLIKRKDGTSLEAFRQWLEVEHLELARKLPGMRRYLVNVAVADNPDAPFDGISEMYFDDEAAMKAAFATPEGAAAGGDAAAHASNRVRLLMTEKVQF
jgi:uncharacterized protein (TIGR02118 family)